MRVILPIGMPRYLTGEPTASPSTEVFKMVTAWNFGEKIWLIPAARKAVISSVIEISEKRRV